MYFVSQYFVIGRVQPFDGCLPEEPLKRDGVLGGGNLANLSQRLGECLGKGAFGSVYKAFNWSTGEAVAVKQIKLADLPKSELRMMEVG